MKDKWYVVDAKGEVVGRLASRIAAVLRGKTDPHFHPAVDPKTHVIVLNADKAILTGRKMKQKLYQWHSGYPHGFKQRTAGEMARQKPGEIMRRAIRGMLPKTRLGDALINHVLIYTGDEHPHKAQQPQPIQLTKSARTA
ncbi:MAG: 50S ribosomal protein L13 [Candidatus Sumerlaeota bacterium]|nr:50S ribosomal protein L13 [Candidatus Sumerlaeota bacterium]